MVALSSLLLRRGMDLPVEEPSPGRAVLDITRDWPARGRIAVAGNTPTRAPRPDAQGVRLGHGWAVDCHSEGKRQQAAAAAGAWPRRQAY